MALDSVVYNKAVDVAQSMPVPVIFAKQGEHHKRKVVVKIMEDGQPFKLASGNTAYVQGATAEDLKTKQRYRFKYNVAEVNFGDSTITFYIDRGMTQVIGITQCELAIYDSGAPDEILCTANINIEVQGTGMSPEDEMASDDYEAIENIKVQVTAMRDEVRTKTNQAIAAQGAAETAAQNAYNSALGIQKIVAGNEVYTKQETDLKYSVAPRKVQTSTTGELKLTDADYGLSYLELQGNSEQYTNTESANLFDLEYNKSLGLDRTSKFLRPNGAIGESVGWSYSYYIKVKQNTLYSIKGVIASTLAAFVFYNKDKTYISGILTNDAVIDGIRAFTTPANCEWVRISYPHEAQNIQMYLGQLPSQSVVGAVDTPSPEYPSEVKSVGDIPKDSDGVEIKNIVDIDGILARPEGDWTVSPSGRSFSIPLDVSKQKIGGRLFETISNTGFNLGLSLNASSLGDSQGFYLAAPSIPYKSFDFSSSSSSSSSSSAVRLFIYVSGTDPIDLAMVKEILDKERNKFVFTYASEVDEYRPYIGENNGLVKIESTTGNLLDTRTLLDNRNNVDVILSENGKKVTVNQKSIDKSGYVLFDFKYEPNKVYTVYCKANVKVISGSGGATMVAIRKKSMTGSIISGIQIETLNQEVLFKFNTGEEVGLGFLLYVQNEPNRSLRMLEVVNPMIVEGDRTLQEMKALKFQPYYNQITWIPLREPLRGIRKPGYNYLDKLDKDGNVTQEVNSEVFPKGIVWSDQLGAEAWSTPKRSIPSDTTPVKVLSEISKFARTGGSFLNDYYARGTLKKTLQEMNDFSTNNSFIVYYALKTPVKYQIPVVYVETYDQETNVRCLNKIKPSSIGLDYKIAISSLIKRLEALESTAVMEVNKNV